MKGNECFRRGFDVAAFRNLMPDALYERMGNAPRPLAERIEAFFRSDLTILADGEPLPGGILEIGPETRVQRDPVTGEPLPPDDAVLLSGLPLRFRSASLRVANSKKCRVIFTGMRASTSRSVPRIWMRLSSSCWE